MDTVFGWYAYSRNFRVYWILKNLIVLDNFLTLISSPTNDFSLANMTLIRFLKENNRWLWQTSYCCSLYATYTRRKYPRTRASNDSLTSSHENSVLYNRFT